MKEDEELQKNIESGKIPSGDDADASAYRHVFNALSREPDLSLPPSFADRVLQKIELQQERSKKREYLWMAAGFFLLAIAFIIVVVASGFKLNLGFLNGLSTHKGLLVFAAAFLIFLQWLDKRLLHKKTGTP